MKISKRSLRTLPVLLLLEMLSPILLLLGILLAYFVNLSGSGAAAIVTAMIPSLLTIAIWIICAVVIYGIMELSPLFAYAWYLHLIYFIIKAVTLVIEGVGAAANPVDAGTVSAIELVPDLLSSLREFIGILSQAMLLFGFCSVMKKTGQEKLSKSCRVIAIVCLTLGILSLMLDGAGYVVQWLNPELAASDSGGNAVITALNVVIAVLTVIISIPAFVAVRKSCMNVYQLLFNAQESCK